MLSLVDNADDRVYMKKDVRGHKLFEKHPNLMFGAIILIWSIVFLGTLFFMYMFSLFFMYMFLFWVLLLAWIPITIWYIKNNERTNLTKSSAFIERNGVWYYIRLGYVLDYQQPGVSFGLKKAAIARENMSKTKHIQNARENPATYSAALTQILETGQLPADVVKFCEMRDCHLEKEDKNWIWLSYYNRHTKNQRVEQKFANVYALPFQKSKNEYY